MNGTNQEAVSPFCVRCETSIRVFKCRVLSLGAYFSQTFFEKIRKLNMDRLLPNTDWPSCSKTSVHIGDTKFYSGRFLRGPTWILAFSSDAIFPTSAVDRLGFIGIHTSLYNAILAILRPIKNQELPPTGISFSVQKQMVEIWLLQLCAVRMQTCLDMEGRVHRS